MMPRPVSATNSVAPLELHDHDVFCGRERLAHSHIGNKAFRHLVQQHREAYQSTARRDTKSSITGQIIEVIHKRGGRFLKLVDGVWTELDGPQTHEKVSHALRSARGPKHATRRNEPWLKKEEEAPVVAMQLVPDRIMSRQEQIFDTLKEVQLDTMTELDNLSTFSIGDVSDTTFDDFPLSSGFCFIPRDACDCDCCSTSEEEDNAEAFLSHVFGAIDEHKL